MRALDVLRDGLAEVWTSQGRTFVTFEVVERGRADAGRWIQYLDGELNIAWPFDEDPRTGLPLRGIALPRGAFIVSHAPGGNAVIAVGDLVLDDVARFVDLLFRRVVAENEVYEVARRVERHG